MRKIEFRFQWPPFVLLLTVRFTNHNQEFDFYCILLVI